MSIIKPFQPLISVIIVVKNACATITSAVESIREQSYSAVECIVIDGASTDGTLEILQNDSSIDMLISEPDRGIYDAMNKGIRHASGEWILFLGADDRLADRNVLARVFSVSYESKLIYGNVRFGQSCLYDGYFSKSKLMWKNICHQAIFYRRELFQKIGLFHERYPLWADWEFNLRAFADPVTKPQHINEVISLYGAHGLSHAQCDHIFLADRLRLIMDLFGPWYTLLYRLLFRPVSRGWIYRQAGHV